MMIRLSVDIAMCPFFTEILIVIVAAISFSIRDY